MYSAAQTSNWGESGVSTKTGAPTATPNPPASSYDGAYEEVVATGGGAVKALLQFFMGVFMFIVVVMIIAVMAYGASQVMQTVAKPLAKFIGTAR